MIAPATIPDLSELLEQAGARPRGRRNNCPKCSGFRTVAHTDECFYCHRCQWKGNVVTLMRELGFKDERSYAEKQRDRRARERAHEAALRLHGVAHMRQLELLAKLRNLGLMELLAHEAGRTEDSWETLASVYAERPAIERELDLLESGDADTVYSVLMKAAECRLEKRVGAHIQK